MTVHTPTIVIEAQAPPAKAAHAATSGKLPKKNKSRLPRRQKKAAKRRVYVVTFSHAELPKVPGEVFSYGLEQEALEAFWRHRLIVVADDTRTLIAATEGTDHDDGVGRPRKGDVVVGPDERSSEHGRIGWQVATHLENVRSVVQPDADDLLGRGANHFAVLGHPSANMSHTG